MTDAEMIAAVAEHGGIRTAARALGVHHSKVQRAVRRSKPHPAGAETPFYVNEKSVLSDGKGNVKLQWEKFKLDQQRADEAMRAGVEAFMADQPALKVPASPLIFQNDIIPWIQIGDAHLGMLAYASVSRENFNLDMAEVELCTGIAVLIDELPNSERIVINDLGDFTHAENIQGVTEGGGHNLDCAASYPDMIRSYSRVMRFIVDKALTKAQHVDVIINQGNHSRKNDMWMAELLRVAYRNTDRVHILNNDSVFIGYRMGKTFVMTHHSDKCKPKQLTGVMTTDFRRDFGETEFHYIDVGHVHHGMLMKEHPSVIVESYNHLAPLDKYAFEGGWRNRRSITMVQRSRSYGEVGRRLLPIEEILDRIAGSVGGHVADQPRAFTV